MKRGPTGQSSLDDFFKVKRVSHDDDGAELLHETADNNSPLSETQGDQNAAASAVDNSCPAFGKGPMELDIGNAVKKNRSENGYFSDEEKRNFLCRRWIPENKQDFPFSLCKRSGQKIGKRYLNNDHLKRFKWLAISRQEDSALRGAWCTFCVLFKTSEYGGGKGAGASRGGGQKMGNLVVKPLTDFSDLTGTNGVLNKHEASNFHRLCAQRADDFLLRSDDSANDVRNLQVEERRSQVMKNRAALKPIVETLLLAGRQNMALRGHRDSGPIATDGSEPEINDGNFRALLRYRMRGDQILKSHLENARKHATYISKDIQNELLQQAAKLIKVSISEDVAKSSFWSVLADETQDKAKREQLVITVRYIMENDQNEMTVHEDPVAVLDLINDIKAHQESECHTEVKLSGAAIGQSILRVIQNFRLDMQYLVGQGYDGAAAMASVRVGVAAEVLKQAPRADYYHCMMHALNLVASQAVRVYEIRHCMDIIQEICTFFKHAKRNSFLVKTIESLESANNSDRKRKLINLCTTRFIERHQSVLVVKALLPAIVACLENMLAWDSGEVRKSARNLLCSMIKPNFLVALVMLEKVSAVLMPVSKLLQDTQMDLPQAFSILEDLTQTLQEMRSESCNASCIDEARDLGKKLGLSDSEMDKRPRFSQRAKHRGNAGEENQSASEYYRLNVLLPLVDGILADTKLRFGHHQKKAMHLTLLLPSKVQNTSWTELGPVMEKFGEFLDAESVVQGEFLMWKQKWAGNEKANQYSTGISAVNQCSKIVYPNVHSLLKILCTLPVTTAEPERVFSKLEKTLTAVRNTMAEERLESLLMLQIHRDRTPSPENIIDAFSASRTRRSAMIL